MATDRKAESIDRIWLTGVLVRLLDGASALEPPDHQACAKYADLLYKMLPAQGKGPTDAALAEIRKAVMEDQHGA